MILPTFQGNFCTQQMLCHALHAVTSNTDFGRDDHFTDSVVHVLSLLPASKGRLDEYKVAQQADAILSQVITFCKHGWPNRHKVKKDLIEFWRVRGELTLIDLLLYGCRIVVPERLQKVTLQKIHYGHQGILRCRERVMSAVWWPGVSQQI